MKIDCNVARDLMPLVIDKAASGESESLVREHARECAACGQYMKELQADLAVREESRKGEAQSFDKVAQSMRRKRHWKILRNVLMGMLVGVLLIIGGTWGWARLTQDYVIPVNIDEYDISLARLTTGTVVANVDYHGSNVYSSFAVTEELSPLNNKTILYLGDMRARVKKHMEQPHSNRVCMEIAASDFNTITEIRQGTPKEYITIWREGDAVPPASAELDTYQRLVNTLCALGQERDGKWLMNSEEQRLSDDIQDQMDALRPVVPEWNN